VARACISAAAATAPRGRPPRWADGWLGGSGTTEEELKTVQDLLGHASIVLTADTYPSVLPCLACQSAKATARLVLDVARSTGIRLRQRRKPRRSPGRRTRPVTVADADAEVCRIAVSRLLFMSFCRRSGKGRNRRVSTLP
jgi:hypothetical protein